MLKLNNIKISNGNKLVLIAGPCVIESEKAIITIAKRLKDITEELEIDLIFKSSFKKANRTSLNSFTGPGIDRGMEILNTVKQKFDLPILTDIHESHEAEKIAMVADIIQIPAFLCRQTDLLLAAGETKKIINIKKGQFLAPEKMTHAIEKVKSTGNNKIMLTERGTTFGYNNLVVDMRALEIMKKLNVPVVMDATHSVQMPGGVGSTTEGNPEFIEPLAKAAVAIGVAALFLEVHPNPPKALSDAGSQLKLSDLKKLMNKLLQIDRIIKNY